MGKEKTMTPTYDYTCSVCGGSREITRVFGEDREPTCCQQLMNRVWSPTPTIFKTGGFYKTGG